MVIRSVEQWSKRFAIEQNRGNPRLLLEGKFLTAAGIERGMNFDRVITGEVDGVHFDTVRMRLDFRPTGKYSVAGTARHPIIDLNGAYLAPLFGGFAHCFAEIIKHNGFEASSISIYIKTND